MHSSSWEPAVDFFPHSQLCLTLLRKAKNPSDLEAKSSSSSWQLATTSGSKNVSSSKSSLRLSVFCRALPSTT
eukprot:589063-Rhodomonas_salina.3